ncbi:kinase-like protein [Westerdykella ornata]|uniref:Kinase-like protein n=1 Tax=Westerdykella ornata TaxID=318751 RepID=A0A6A6JP41_WESOR|nr:kinase-like protein [Westerdykella ornata]KAF2278015.1 kinase-like protein [Westerdykella ornata]
MLLGQRIASCLHKSFSILWPQSEPFSIGAALRGHSGRTYSVQEILTERRGPLLCVYRARRKLHYQNMIPGEFEYQQNLQKPLASCPHLRTVDDTIPDFELFVYHFLNGDLLQISQKTLSKETRRSILRSAFTGLAELHDRGIIHTDIKPSNILLDYDETAANDLTIEKVQISDLEDAVLLPPGKNLKGCLCGNQLWRSPESWARARQRTPSDIFSFGVVAIYVVLNDMIFRVSDEELSWHDAWRHILRRHISYFGDEDGFRGLLRHIGEENPFFERLVALAGDFDAERPRKPFTMWQYVDGEFRDLIMKMANLDPARRITAREALEHAWFRQADSGPMALKHGEI